MTAYTAHRQWASRPPDERYASVQALYEAARACRDRTQERTIETGDVRTQALADDDLPFEASNRAAAFTHWSFGQLAGIAGAPPNYRRTLPASIAAEASMTGSVVRLELGPTREAVLDAAVQRLHLSQRRAAEAYTLAEQDEPNPRSVWGYGQGLTRLSRRTPWQDGRFALDRAASRLLTTVH